MKFKLKDLGALFKTTYKKWNKSDPFRQSAVIAYYAIFSLPGLLVLIVTITGYFFGNETVNNNIFFQVSTTMGIDTATEIRNVLSKAVKTQSTVWGSIIGVSTILIGATGVFVELQKTLNQIWQVKVKAQTGILDILKARLFSFGLILAIAFLLIISLVVSTAISAVSNWIKVDTSGFMVVLFQIVNFIFSLSVISILFAMMFKILPDAQIKWKHVWLGGVVTGLLFTIGKTALAYYFGTAEPESVYGAAGSIILVMLWVSYSSMILFFGAEFTAAYADMYSEKVAPTEIAKIDALVKSN